MKAGFENRFELMQSKKGTNKSSEDKFELIGCPINGIHCSSTLKEINELYASAELYRINKEYQISEKILQEAYEKTFLLEESSCAGCVELFQESISNTLKIVHAEANIISSGLIHTTQYNQVVKKITSFVKKFKFA